MIALLHFARLEELCMNFCVPYSYGAIVFDLREQKRWFAFLYRFQLALFAIKFKGGYDATKKIK